MRYFILTTLLVFLFSFSAITHAQEIETMPPIIENSEDIIEPKDESIFSKASDKQIEEARKFYDSCTENETMNNLKNCKCAASEYLDKRSELGDEASIKEIMSANANKCLKDDKNSSSANGEHKTDISDVTEAQLAEAEGILENCQNTLKLSRYYDCECYAAKFLDGRIKKGPLVSQEEILMSFYSECRNIVETTGYEYTKCMAMTTKQPVKNIEPKDFCECYARQWAKQFESYQGLINLSSKTQMKLRARSYCGRQANYN